MGYTPRMLDERSKEDFFFELSGYEKRSYPVRETYVAYSKCEYIVYHYNKKEELIIDSILLCTGVTATNKGVRVSIIDKRSYSLHTVGDIPQLLVGHNILAHVPTRCMVTKTVRLTSGPKKLEGLTAAFHVLSKTAPELRTPGDIQVVPLSKRSKYFTNNEYDLALARVEAQIMEG